MEAVAIIPFNSQLTHYHKYLLLENQIPCQKIALTLMINYIYQQSQKYTNTYQANLAINKVLNFLISQEI